MIRRQPSSPLFPYTTLFRSRGRIELRGSPIGGLAPHRIARKGLILIPQGDSLFPGLPVRDNLRNQEDRKSTRLNSSHTVISYAVFCLKKKKKKSNTQLYEAY